MKSAVDLGSSFSSNKSGKCTHDLFQQKEIEVEMGQHMDELLLPTDAECQRALLDWNDTKREYPRNECIHQLFEKQAARNPEAVAVVFEDQKLTYGELNAQSNQLAHYLRNLGVGPDGLVGICVERSLEMLVGLLGILKAGGAYVPLDPAYPSERLGFMLEDTKIPVLLTQRHLLESLPAHSANVVCLDRDLPQIELQNTLNLDSGVSPENLAYVIYTSGSTGKPKGVMIQHQAFVNFVVSMHTEPGLSATDIVLALTTLSFDIAGLELFGSLTIGAQVVMVPRNVATDGLRLLEFVQRSTVTVMQGTPATWRMLLDAGWRDKMPLKIICGGEALSHQLAVELDRRVNSVWNLYGPTETTVWSTLLQVDAMSGLNTVPIGRPIANTQVYILDEQRESVPLGASGELYIGGHGLARGYLNRLDLTAEKFVSNPFGESGSRLYRTGDLARYLADGNIEFLGRIDHQVKIRGFRIELGEIESVLAHYPGIRQAVVLAREDVPGDKRLVAYLLAVTPPNTKELRNYVKEKLPEYMIPSAFVTLDSMPLTPNGKVDRKALPKPGHLIEEGPINGHPTNALEMRLAETWARILNIDQIGIDDDFFEMGGDSLIAVKLIAEIHRDYGATPRLDLLFRARTIRRMSLDLAKTMTGNESSPIDRINAFGTLRPLFCLPGLGAHTFMYYDMARELGPDQPIYGIQLTAFEKEKCSMALIATKCIGEMKQVQPNGPYQLLGYSLGGSVVFEMARQLVQEGETVAFLGLLDTDGPDYPRLRSIGSRILRHFNHLIFSARGKRLAYLKSRFEALQKRFHKTPPPIAADSEIPSESAVVKTIEKATVPLYEAWRKYIPTRYQGHVTVFRAEQFTEHLGSDYSDPSMGWQKVSKSISIHCIPGGHLDLFKQPHISGLAKYIRENLSAETLNTGSFHGTHVNKV